FLQTTLVGQYTGLSFYTWVPPFDPDEYYIYWRSGQPRNDAKVNDPQIDKLIEDQRVALDPKARQAVWAELQRYAIDKCYYVFGPNIDVATLVSKNLVGYKPTP